ncbi:hypothetical protein GCM10029964_058680 [Kibdelosporangium lantanae]
MGDDSLFYQPRNPVTSAVGARLGGPTPSRVGDPAVLFNATGVEYHESYGGGVTTRLAWKDVRAVAVLPGPVGGRQALCVYPVREIPAPDVPAEERWSGSGRGLSMTFRRMFGTPLAVHWHHVRGPSLRKLAKRLPAWTDGRISLTWGFRWGVTHGSLGRNLVRRFVVGGVMRVSMVGAGGNGANTARRDADLLRRCLIDGHQNLLGAVGDYERRMFEYGAALPAFAPGRV